MLKDLKRLAISWKSSADMVASDHSWNGNFSIVSAKIPSSKAVMPTLVIWNSMNKYAFTIG